MKNIGFRTLFALLAACAVPAPTVAAVAETIRMEDLDAVQPDIPGMTAVLRLYSQEEIDIFLQGEDMDVAVVGYFPLPETEEQMRIFKEVGNVLEQKYRFAFTTDEAVLADKGFDSFGIFLYKPVSEILSGIDQAENRYPENELTHTMLSWFIETRGLPLVGVKTDHNRKRYEDIPIPEFTVYTEVDLDRNPAMLTSYVTLLLPLAQQNFGLFTFSVVELKKLLPQFPYSIGMTAREGMVTIRQHSTYFIPENDFVFGTEGASLFIDAVRGGGRPGRLPTPPQANDFAFDHAVVQLTTKSFNTVVHHDTSKDVLVLFYAPWCGHCRSLKPAYESVARTFLEEKNIVISAMDATVNTVPREFSVKGYPTIVLSPTSGGMTSRPVPIQFEGARDADAIVAFVRRNAYSLQK